MKFPFLIILFLTHFFAHSQHRALAEAMDKLSGDGQFSNATIALSVSGSGGETIFRENGDLGINPASSLKVVTSSAAFELLGKNFRFTTRISIAKSPDGKGDMLIIAGSGDPSFGSDRWRQTRPEAIFSLITETLKRNNITSLPGGIYIHHPGFTYQPVPHGWVWEDVGNYYGAGAWGLNWKENAFEIDLFPGKNAGDPVTVTATRPLRMADRITSFVVTGAKGTGDKSLVFSAPHQQDVFITGTIPPEQKLTIGASLPDPPLTFGNELKDFLIASGIITGPVVTFNSNLRAGKTLEPENVKELIVYKSPPLDSLNYWFMNKSINLYGEAFIKAIAFQKSGEASTEKGVEIVQDYFYEKGIAKGSLKMIDGSGLSPSNRVTTTGLVKVLQFAQTRPWFNSFYFGLPAMNKMKLKSGYMEGVRSYTGIVTAGNGRKYFVAFAVNNFHGNAGEVRQKMWKLLDVLL